jgi:hypothetical protein
MSAYLSSNFVGWVEFLRDPTSRRAMGALGLGIAREDTRAETPVFAGWCRKRPDVARPNLRCTDEVIQ